MVIYVKFICCCWDCRHCWCRFFFHAHSFCYCCCFCHSKSFWTMFRFICFLSLAYKRTRTDSRASLWEITAFMFTMNGAPFWKNAYFFFVFLFYFMSSSSSFEISVVHFCIQNMNTAIATAAVVKIKWCGKWHAFHSTSAHSGKQIACNNI